MKGNAHTVAGLFDELTRGFPRPWQARSFLWAIGALAFFFPFSLFFVAGGFLPPQFSWMSSVIIILAGIATFLSELRTERVATAAVRLVGVAVPLFLVELIGSRTGYPFGRYEYTNELGLLVAGVPVAISVAWYCTVVNAWRIAERLVGGNRRSGVLARALLGGLLALGLDVALEPVAGFVEGYWVWQSGSVPLQNYLSWFLLSAMAVCALSALPGGRRVPARSETAIFGTALFLYGFQFTLFLATILVHGYIAEAAVAMILVLGPSAILGRRARVLLSDLARR